MDTKIMNNLKSRLLHHTALVLVANFVVLGTAFAADYSSCKDGICDKPKNMGRQAMTSRVETREVDATHAGQTEFRHPADEVFSVYQPAHYDTNGKVQDFPSAIFDLGESQKKQIETILSKVSGKNISKIQIVGHADVENIAKDAKIGVSDNQQLSEARAKQVYDFLVPQLNGQNIPVTTAGMSDTQAVKLCKTVDAHSPAYKDCLSPDRRVDILVWYKKNACDIKQASTRNLPFRISIDGQPVDTADAPNSADLTRCTDIALEKADIQVRYDSLEDSRALNVTALSESAVRGGTMSFVPYSNYAHFINVAEIRIFEVGDTTQKQPLSIINLDKSLDKDVTWDVPEKSELKDVQYILRVYNADGKFDETAPKILHLTDKSRPMDDVDTPDREELTGYGENHLAIKNIPVTGGMVTINGDKIPAGSTIKALGRDIPVDKNGRFAYRQVMPAGNHVVDVVMAEPNGTQSEFSRPLYIPDSDWFYIGLADLTIGRNNVKGPASLVTGDNSKRYQEKTYADGRLAFYSKGKVKGDWLLTASADTREQPLEDLFSNFSEKDPRYLLKRIDPNAYYPVYGDDSTTVEDAPTQGKFYVKLEKGNSHVMWGNFQTKITGTELLNYGRGLYGANAEYSGEATTSYGEKRTEANLFVADPGTLPSLEEFRGTGGSLYYLRGQDVVTGSERLRVETRDKDSGIVLTSKYLVAGQDYDVNYIQGRLTLREPLSSTSSDNQLIRTGNLSGNPVYLVAEYEYNPSVTSVSNMTKGGRVSHWVNDSVRVGMTGYQQDGTGIDQKLTGADVTLRYTPSTYLKLEKARSDGAGSGSLSSANGGFNFGSIAQTRSANIKADAHRAEIAADLAEILGGKAKGNIGAYTMRRDDGFSSPGQLTSEGVTQHGMTATIPLSDALNLNGKADYKSGSTTGTVRTGEISGDYKYDPEHTLTIGVRHDDRETNLAAGNSNILSETGARTDVGAKLLYAPLDETGEKKNYEVYGLAQGTVNKESTRSNNNRLGVGGEIDVTDKVTLTGEATTGSGGWGGKVGAEYAASDRTSYYANYLMDTERSDTGYRGRNSSFTLGGKSRYSDSLSVFAEERHQSQENGQSGLIHSFGLDLAANDKWTYGGRFENGTISDVNAGDIDRTAVSLSTGYNAEKTKYAGTAEVRLEDSSTVGDRTSWLFKNNLSYQTTPDWRALGQFNIAVSDSGLNGSLDADYIEFGAGYAYRPVLNDRLNALFKYTYLADNPSPAQLNGTQTVNISGYEQRSHVLSADAIYDLTQKLSVGGKIGYRLGQLKDTDVAGSQWFDSQALLLIARADWHVVKEWDVTGELRYLDAKEAKDSKAGALIAAYKHINQNVKLGVGYNFTDFSDDLTDLDYKSKGPFINILGKF